MAHTLGPWKAQSIKGDNSNLVYKRIMASDKPVAFAGVYKHPNAEANARLIAAAPDLLEACKMIIEFSNDNDIHRFLEIAIPKIEQAIAKAEGRDE